MKISKVAVVRGKKIDLETAETEHFEIQMEAQIEEKDDPQEIIQGLKSILDRHLLAWEQKLRGNSYSMESTPQVNIKTASDLIEQPPDQQSQTTEAHEPLIESKSATEEMVQLICPKCNEKMVKKEGKDYYLCSKHWGYPDMIKAGQVREKRF